MVHSSDGDRRIDWNGERFVAVSFDGGMIMYSADGNRRERAHGTATRDTLHDIAWGNGRFVAVGRNGTIVISP